jgi:stalled ribosome rescue protein Dom34
MRNRGEKMETSEKRRDYQKEHSRRKETKRRLRVDMDKNKADEFTNYLKSRGLTFTKWINNQIDKELK